MNSPLPLTEVLMRQRRAWQTGQRPTIESLLQTYLHFSSDRDALLDLIYNEVVLREEVGERATLDDYLPRFPQVAEELRLQFEVDEALTVLRPQPGTPLSTVTTSSPEDAEVENLPRLEGCDLLDELGRGAMGIVYRGWQRAAKRPVAVKLLPTDVPIGRVRNEVQAVSRLHHPNIVGVYEVKEHEGRTALVLEYVESGNLAQKLGGKPVAPAEAAHLVEVLARAMDYAHARGVIHRDLKPSNILLSGGHDAPLSRCTPKISDFGLAKLIEDSPHLTRTSDILGTPSYMAPEQAGGALRDVGPASDLYALGAILYECLTGRPPFLGQGMLDTLELVRTQDPVQPRELNPSVPRDLEVICLKCLHKQPERRYCSAHELAEDLRRLQAGEPIRGRPVGLAERLWKAARRRPMTTLLTGITLLATAALLLGTLIVGQILRAERDVAVRQAKELEQRLAETRSLLYTAELLRVAALRETDPAAALRRLEDPIACPPELRDLSWRILWRQCRPYQAIERTHTAPLRAVIRSNDGTTLVSLDRAGNLWDGPSRLVGVWPDAEQLAVAGNAQRLALGRTGGRITWHDRDPMETGEWTVGRTIGGLALQRDGRVLAINGGPVGKPGTLTLHEARTGKVRRTFKEATNPRSPVVFSPDDTLVVCALEDESIQIWDARTGRPVVRLTGFDAPISALAFTPQGQRLAAGATDGIVRVWEVSSGRERDRIPGEVGAIQTLAFHPSLPLLVLGGRGRESEESPADLQVWDLNERRGADPLRAHGGTMALGFEDDATLWTGGRDRTVKRWSFPGERLRIALRGKVGDAALVACSETSVAWVSRAPGEPDSLVVFDRPRGTQQLLRAPGRTFRSLALPGHGRFLLTGSGIPSEPGEALLWDPELGRPIQALPGHRTPVVAVACTPEGDRAATACDDGSVRLWRLEGSRIQGETTLESAPLALAAGPEGGWLVLLSRELVWLDDSARMVQRLALPEPCRHLTVSGPVWCVGGEQGVWLGHRNANEPPTLLDANTREVASLALVDEGRTLAVATGRTVRLWDVASRQERLSLGGHAGGVLWVGFSPHACLSIARNGQLHTWPVAPQNRVGERSH